MMGLSLPFARWPRSTGEAAAGPRSSRRRRKVASRRARSPPRLPMATSLAACQEQRLRAATGPPAAAPRGTLGSVVPAAGGGPRSGLSPCRGSRVRVPGRSRVGVPRIGVPAVGVPRRRPVPAGRRWSRPCWGPVSLLGRGNAWITRKWQTRLVRLEKVY